MPTIRVGVGNGDMTRHPAVDNGMVLWVSLLGT